MTKHACEFVQPLTFRALSGSYVVVDDYSPDNPDPIAHITFSQSVDLFVVAPATADIIAKFANGIADDFVSSTYLACNAPVLVAPAMNTVMWNHPATQRNLRRLRDDGVTVLEPDEGEMACGTIGPGRLSDPETIVDAALSMLRTRTANVTQDLAGETFLITAGATREEIDPVRFISNRSSGRMGFALAEAALRRGADVTIVSGSTSVPPPSGAEVIKTASAEEMRVAVLNRLPNASVFVAAAAVSDYRPKIRSAEKLKKSDHPLVIELEPAPDILAEVSDARQNGQLVIGFAAETSDLIANARAKLERKKLDAIVANDVSQTGIGFDSQTNAVTILTANTELEIPAMSKIEIAHRILNEIVKLRQKQQQAPHADTVAAH
jgi:phosphopantothenoylcysteine decarboxylase/phosphopantothenate--cysteine ligase